MNQGKLISPNTSPCEFSVWQQNRTESQRARVEVISCDSTLLSRCPATQFAAFESIYLKVGGWDTRILLVFHPPYSTVVLSYSIWYLGVVLEFPPSVVLGDIRIYALYGPRLEIGMKHFVPGHLKSS